MWGGGELGPTFGVESTILDFASLFAGHLEGDSRSFGLKLDTYIYNRLKILSRMVNSLF